MEEKVIIGTKKTKAMIMKGYLLVLLYAFVPLLILIAGFAKLSEDLGTALTYIFGSLVLLSIILIFFTPMVATSQYLEITSEKICYYYSETLRGQLQTVKAILLNQTIHPAIIIETKDIINLSLSYQPTMMKGIRGYALVLNFMTNHEIITMIMDDLISQEGVYLKALDKLIEVGVEIIDPYHLRPGLIKDTRYFQEYVKKICKEKA